MKKDKRYSLLCIAVLLMAAAPLLVSSGEGMTSDDSRTGVVSDVRGSARGFTFTFEDHDGMSIRCFHSKEPSENSVCRIKGSFSDDGSMFFVSYIERLDSEQIISDT